MAPKVKYDLHYGRCTGAGETFNSHHGQYIIETNCSIRSVAVLLKRSLIISMLTINSTKFTDIFVEKC